MDDLTNNITQLLKQQNRHIGQDSVQECNDSAVVLAYRTEIRDAHAYLLCSQGKLIRPLLILLIAGWIGGDDAVQLAYPAALSIECVHTYSLVHDDLPCMDNDTLRRGCPTTHVIYGDAKALLVGDGLLSAAFSILSRNINKIKSDLLIELIQSLSEACGSDGMIFGQWLDISEPKFPPMEHMTESEKSCVFHTIHKNKTGKLFASCFEMGFLCGVYASQKHKEVSDLFAANDKETIQNQFYDLGIDIGLSFQITDDILDVTQNSETLGKTSGKDAAQNKWNAVKVFGLEHAVDYARTIQNHVCTKLHHLNDTYFKNDKNLVYFQNLLALTEKISQRQS